MSATCRSSALSAMEARKYLLRSSRSVMAEQHDDNEEKQRQLREEYERLLHQLDRKPIDGPKPGDVPTARPENPVPRRR